MDTCRSSDPVVACLARGGRGQAGENKIATAGKVRLHNAGVVEAGAGVYDELLALFDDERRRISGIVYLRALTEVANMLSVRTQMSCERQTADFQKVG